MKIVVGKTSLETCVKNLCKVINTKNALPILNNIRFDVDEKEKKAKLSASDSEIWLTYTVMLDVVEGGGSFCVNARWLAAMLTEVTEQPLTIIATTETTNMFTIEYQDGSSFCPIDNAEEYPEPRPAPEKTSMVTVNTDILKRTIKRSLWSTADDDLRPVMNGIFFDFEVDRLDVVATDGHHMIKSSNILNDVNESGSFIMLKKVAKIISDILDFGDIIMEFDDKICSINTGSVTLQFIFIEGKYPNYNSIIPTESKYEIGCDRYQLLKALMAVSPFSNESSNMIVLTFDGDTLEVSGNDYDMSIGARKSISIEGNVGEKISIGAKASPLITMISKLKSNDLILKFSDPSHAIVIEPSEDSDDDTEQITGLTMPMYLND